MIICFDYDGVIAEVLEPPYGVVRLENELRGEKRPKHLVRQT